MSVMSPYSDLFQIKLMSVHSCNNKLVYPPPLMGHCAFFLAATAALEVQMLVC